MPKPSQPKFKDWKEGEVRIKLEIVLEDGSKLAYYIPHLKPRWGLTAIDMATKMIQSDKVEETHG